MWYLFNNLRLVTTGLPNCRGFCTRISENNVRFSSHFVNRNPRNLEHMQIAYKPDGYHVEKPGKSFWYKLKLSVTGRYVTGTIEHFENGEILKASTSEWALKKYLYKCKDTSAFYNLGRVLAERCLRTGITQISCDIIPRQSEGKIAKLMEALQQGGVTLREPPQFKPARSWDQHRFEKPWD